MLAGCEPTTPVPDVVSRTFTLETSEFDTKLDPSGENTVSTMSYDVREITEKIIAAGTVMAEIDLGSEGTEWSALPLTWHFMDRSRNPHVVEFQPRYKKGKFTLLLRGTTESIIDGVAKADGLRLRVIVISGNSADG